MKLYLQRHAHPIPGERMDSARGLDKKGREQTAEMAAFMTRMVGHVDIVICSPFARAIETAEPMAKALGAHVATTRMLEPDGEPEEIWAEIERLAPQAEDVLVVGHDPSLNLLLRWLLDTPASDAAIHFRHGGVAHVESGAKLKEARGEYYYDEVEVKRWILGDGGNSGENCEFCEENADMGWVDMDAVFVSPDGDIDDVPAHLHCSCTVEQATKRRRVYASDRAPRAGLQLYESKRKPVAVLHWLVTPKLVERDQAVDEVIEAAAEVIESFA